MCAEEVVCRLSVSLLRSAEKRKDLQLMDQPEDGRIEVNHCGYSREDRVVDLVSQLGG